MNRPLILASKSPRRRELLGGMGLAFSILTAETDERLDPGIHPRDGVGILARRKAEAVRPLAPQGALVLGSDTLVELDGLPLGKPRDDEDAVAMLMRLSGKEHRVHTGVCLLCGDLVLSEVDSAHVFMRRFTEEEARAYVATGEPRDKAGAYAIQGLGSALVERREGALDTVIGLPCEVVRRLLSRMDELLSQEEK